MSGQTSIQPPHKRIGRQISTGSDSSLAYSSNASEASDGEFITAFDRCPPTFSDDVLDREDLFPTPSTEVIGGTSYSNAWETEHELAVLEEMSNEWTMFSDPSFENRNPMNVTKNMGALQRDYHEDEVLERSYYNGGVMMMPNVKSARLVSPDSSPNRRSFNDGGNTFPVVAAAPATSASTAVATATNDELSAWGFTTTDTTTVDNRESTTKTTAKQDAFGSNFFNNSGFDDDDDDDGDCFFGQSDWAATVSSRKPLTNENKRSAIGGDDVEATSSNNDPWGTGRGGVNPFTDEKKDEDTGSVIFTSVSLPDPITPTMEPINSHPLKQQQQQPQSKAKNEVVVSFEDYGIQQSPSNSSFSSRPLTLERNVSYERSNRPPVTAKTHRRINSNGSQSQGSRRRSPGSVGSNSSAVDQILEHYRQKRLAKHHNGRTVSATSSTASSQPSSSNHRSIPSIDSLSSIPSSAIAAVAAATPTAAAAVAAFSPSNDTTSSVQSSLSRPMSSNQQPSPSPPTPPLFTNQNNNRGGVNWPDDNGTFSASTPAPPTRIVNETTSQPVDDAGDKFLMANIEATIGPPGCAPDMESLRGGSPRRRNRQSSDARSVDSRTSRNSRYSFRTYESNRSALKSMNGMTPESKSVANDLFRLEAQLAEVARQQELQGDEPVSSPREVVYFNDNTTLDKNNSSTSDMSSSNGHWNIGAEPVPRHNPITVVAPPGRLGILLSNNKAGGVISTPTYVSAVRSESVLAGKVQVGDLFLKIDGEDVSQLTSKMIMTIMAQKSEFERVLEFRCLQSSYDPHQEWI